MSVPLELTTVIGAGLTVAGFIVLCLVRFDCSLLRGTRVPRQRESATALRKQQPLRASFSLHGWRTR